MAAVTVLSCAGLAPGVVRPWLLDRGL